MKVMRPAAVAITLLLAGCASVAIPPEQTAWAESVRRQIAQATDTHYVYIPVENKQQRDIVEALAFKQGKQTQRIKKDGKVTECIFVFRY
jgi:hypothetical protein